MFERYTERARRVLFFARYEATQLGGHSIETEHLLLGLVREGKGLTSRLFARAHVSLEGIRKAVEARTVSRERLSTSVEIPFSTETTRALQHAADEADRMLHNYIGTEHLLLGLLREERSVAAAILMEEGLQLEKVRTDIEELLQGRAGTTTPPDHWNDAAPVVWTGQLPIPANSHVVLVQLTVRPELLEDFEAALLHNARESLAKDPGCLRFDVSQHTDDPQRWILHEVYTNPEAHAAHRQSAHFLAYNEVAERAVLEKTVATGIGRHLV